MFISNCHVFVLPVELLGYLWWWRKLYKAHHCMQITSLFFFFFSFFFLLQTAWWVSSGAQVHPTSADPPDPQWHGEGQRSDQRAGLLHRGQRRPDRRACQTLLPWTGQEGTLVRLSAAPFSSLSASSSTGVALFSLTLYAKSVGWDRRELYPQGSMLFSLLPACSAVTVMSLKVSLMSHNFSFFSPFVSVTLLTKLMTASRHTSHTHTDGKQTHFATDALFTCPSAREYQSFHLKFLFSTVLSASLQIHTSSSAFRFKPVYVKGIPAYGWGGDGGLV